ncbi:hypothetical protein WJX72_010089 [[Myrmecia] bisecta]|uniref:RING-type domain-containing protein n=1 Tax=[Myrmecia] bisecta TaxID=41462 RepID=A0AAW1Q9S8_9CHLO
MGNSLGCQVGCQSQGPALLAAAANGDLETVRAITATYPDAGFYRTFRGNNTVLAVAAEGGDVELLKVIYEAAELARGSLEARHCLNSQAAKGHTPLMRACLRGHEECVAYMLSKGADVFLESSKGETCLHLAAKSSDMGTITHLLRSTVVNAASNPPATQLADVMLQAWGGPIKFADLRNAAGLTALHVATLKGSATAVHALLRHGASVDAGVMGSNYAPWLSRGSTALHIAAAKGFQACVTVILEFQAAIPGLDLRHVRNQQGLKPSTLARMAGHTALARVLSDVRPYVPYVSRARQRLEGTGRRSAKASSPQAVLAMLIQRAKLLLSLRAIALQLQEGKAPAVLDKDDKTAAWLADGDSDEKAGQVAKEVAEVADAWRRGHASAGSAASILNILAALDTGKSSEPAGDNSADEGDQSLSNTSSYAAAALVQAALNAMACSASTEPLDTSPTSLSPTTPVAAAVVVQAALRSLSGPRRPRVAPSPAEAGHSTADDADDTDTGPDRPRRPHRLLSAQSRARAAASSGAPPAVRELVSHPLDPLNFTEAPLSASQSTYLRNVISRLRGRPHRRGAALSVPAPAAGTDTQRQRPTTAATAAATLQRTRSGRRNVLADALADRISSLRTTAMTLRSHEAPSPMADLHSVRLYRDHSNDYSLDLGGESEAPPRGLSRDVSNDYSLDLSPESELQSRPLSRDVSNDYSMDLETESKHQSLAAAARLVKQHAAAFGCEEASSSSSPDKHTEKASVLQPGLPSLLSFHQAELVTTLESLSEAESVPDAAYRTPKLQSPNKCPASAVSPRSAPGQPALASAPQPAASPSEAPAVASQALQAVSRQAMGAREPTPASNASAGDAAMGAGLKRRPPVKAVLRSPVRASANAAAALRLPAHQGGKENSWPPGSVSAEDVSSSRDLMATDLAATDLTATDLAESNARSAAGTDTDVLTTDEPEVLEGRSAFGPPALSVNTKGKNAVKEGERCAICMDRPLEVLIGGCDHQLCVRCAYQLCARGLSAPLCPYCRRSIAAFHPVCGQSSGGQELRT